MQNQDSNPEKPRGCLACRAMKVKCDRTLPHCQRCQKRRKTCPGYVGEATVTFRSMNRFAETQVKARTISRNKNPASTPGTLANRECLQLQQPRKTSIPMGMDTDWRAVAVPRFFEDHGKITHPNRDISVHFLKQVVIENPRESYLSDALQAVAFASLANQTGQAWLNVEARQAFGSAIHDAAIVLHNPPREKNDALLATTVFFDFFEMLFTRPTTGSSWSFMHERGRISLLRLRGKDQSQSVVGKQMLRLVCSQHVIKCIIMHLEPPDEVEEWMTRFASRKEFSRFGCLNLRNARICAKAQILFESPIQDDEWVLQILQVIKDGLKLEDDYHSWGLELSMAPDFQIKQLKSSIPTGGRYPIYVYNDLFVAFIWDNSRTVRIHLLEVLKRCDALLQAQNNITNIEYQADSIEDDATALIEGMVLDICSTIPFFLGEVDSKGNLIKVPHRLPLAGHMATWAIYIAMVSSQHDSCRESWLRSKLELISNSMGIRLASRLAQRARREPWDLKA